MDKDVSEKITVGKSDPARPDLEVIGSRQFNSWLEEQKISLAFTTYQSGKLFLIGLQLDGRLSVFERTFNRCMGLYTTPHTLYMTSSTFVARVRVRVQGLQQ